MKTAKILIAIIRYDELAICELSLDIKPIYFLRKSLENALAGMAPLTLEMNCC